MNMSVNLISDFRSAADMLRMLAWKKKHFSEPNFPLTSRQNQCHGKQRALLSGRLGWPCISHLDRWVPGPPGQQ